jgi:polygalacturonase
MKRIGLMFVVVLTVLGNSFAQTTQPAQSIIVTDMGAVGDGTTVNTVAIQRALNAISARGGGEVVIPAGNFVTGSIVLGPRTTLRFEKDAILTGSPNIVDYPIINVRWEGEWRPGHRALIFANNVDHIAVIGEGKIVGPPIALAGLRPNAGGRGGGNRGAVRGAPGAPATTPGGAAPARGGRGGGGQAGDARGPSIIEPIECHDVRMEGFSIQYQRMWNVHLTYCSDVVVRNLNIRSDTRQSNGDGVDIDSCKNVLVEGCDIETGDDAICLKSGRGLEAVRIARPAEDIVIRNNTLSCPSFACIGMGTEMSGGIRNVRIENNTFNRAVNGIFIKSRTGRAGFIENITVDGMTVSDQVQHLIEIDLVNKGIAATENATGVDAYPHLANITLNNVKTQARDLFVVTAIAPEKPAENITFSNVTGTCQNGIKAQNIRNFTLKNINVSGYQGPFLNVENVTGPKIESIKEPKDTQ